MINNNKIFNWKFKLKKKINFVRISLFFFYHNFFKLLPKKKILNGRLFKKMDKFDFQMETALFYPSRRYFDLLR